MRRDRLIERLQRLYATISNDGKDLVIDSSKHPAYAYLLRRMNVSLRCVLVVRDPRGVAYSWSKVVRRPETTDGDGLMPRYSAASTVMNWTTYGLMFHLLPALGVPVMTVHYEDFMRHPRDTVSRVLRFAGRAPEARALAHISDTEVHLGTHHTVAGNPMRFKTGDVRLRFDDEWRTKMEAFPRAAVALGTAPMRAFYSLQRRRAHAPNR